MNALSIPPALLEDPNSLRIGNRELSQHLGFDLGFGDC